MSSVCVPVLLQPGSYPTAGLCVLNASVLNEVCTHSHTRAFYIHPPARAISKEREGDGGGALVSLQ